MIIGSQERYAKQRRVVCIYTPMGLKICMKKNVLVVKYTYLIEFVKMSQQKDGKRIKSESLII